MQPTATIHLGDNRDILKTIETNSIDSVVTDPPYELGFMGKAWDASGIAYQVTLWAEVLRVLKPGGHLLAFGGTRTYHRMAVAIEDAGFEIRDSIHWIYGSGFPKSLDVSKAIDKRGGTVPWQADFAAHLRSVKPKEVSTAAINAHVANGSKSNFWSHFIDTKSQPLLPTVDQYRRLREILPIDPFWDACFLPEAEREVVKEDKRVRGGTSWETKSGMLAAGEQDFSITAPATEAAKQWQGWGTALKPAHEPIVVARKPLEGTVAANVLKYGTGALNIDATRIPIENKPKGVWGSNQNGPSSFLSRTGTPTVQHANGRWPANVIHDGSDEVTAMFPKSSGGAHPKKRNDTPNVAMSGRNYAREIPNRIEMGDSGSAARFFYAAKASRAERNAGLNTLQPQRHADRPNDNLPGGNNPRNRTNTPKTNFHPTVKPLALMRYLLKLVTPPGGTTLDPFAGSGTTLVAAIHENLNSIGIELTPEYHPIIQARINHAQATRQTTTQPGILDPCAS
jgi:DNA modification methylase